MILDTSFLIELLRGKNLSAKEKAENLDRKFAIKAITSISVMELWSGALQSQNREKEKKKVHEIIQSLPVYSFGDEEARTAGEIEAALIKKGETIDIEDIMIAAIALVHNEPLLTGNPKHFTRIPNLTLEKY
ncbi:MAG TPA: PIN domain-containing protein [Candidatus Nanoarchaeia archaeon]|nr:PIN domain-containing protein [Candidatus Nanoarchaeia archaeon]